MNIRFKFWSDRISPIRPYVDAKYLMVSFYLYESYFYIFLPIKFLLLALAITNLAILSILIDISCV